MKEETKRRINKLVLPLTKRTLSILSAATIITTGLAACKSKTKDNTSDISTKITTSSEEDILVNDNNETIDSSNEVVADNNSEVVTSDEKASSSTKSGSTTTKTSGGSTTNSGNKKANGGTSNNPSNSASAPSSGTTTNPTPAPSTPQTAMPSTLTSSNINDPAVFNHFAEQLRKEIGHNIIIYDDIMTQGSDEVKVALALMNYEYLNNDLISEVFGTYSKEQLNQFGEFMDVFAGMIDCDKKILNYNKYFINKAVGNSVVQLGTEMIKLCSGQPNNAGSLMNSFYSGNSTVNYSNVNSWVNYYVKYLYITACTYDQNSVSGWSAGTEDYEAIYFQNISNLYTKSKTKVK